MKISMSRNITNKVHWALDNLLPPVVRESKLCMGLLAWVIYGKYGKYYLNFKEDNHYLNMTDDEIKDYYVMIEPIITRPTDINKECLDILLERSSGWGGKKILDISCGRGFLSNALHEKCPDADVYGCDINIPKALRKSEGDHLHFVEGSIVNMPFEDNFFDVVISAHTLEHVIDAKKGYEELKRVCKDDLIIIVPCQREYKYTMDFHVQFFPYPHSLIQFTGNNDAKCKKISGDLFYEEHVG